MTINCLLITAHGYRLLSYYSTYDLYQLFSYYYTYDSINCFLITAHMPSINCFLITAHASITVWHISTVFLLQHIWYLSTLFSVANEATICASGRPSSFGPLMHSIGLCCSMGLTLQYLAIVFVLRILSCVYLSNAIYTKDHIYHL